MPVPSTIEQRTVFTTCGESFPTRDEARIFELKMVLGELLRGVVIPGHSFTRTASEFFKYSDHVKEIMQEYDSLWDRRQS